MPRTFLAAEGTEPDSLRCDAHRMHRSDAYQASVVLALEGPGCEPIQQGVPIDRGGIDGIVAMFAFTQPSRHLTDT
jgi:hypothetical protein